MNRMAAYLLRGLWPRVATRQIAERLPDYVEQCAADRIGLRGEPVVLDKLESGHVTLVRRWMTRGAGTLYVRAWSSDRLRRPARHFATASELLSRAGLTTPRLLLVDDSWATLRRWRLEAAIEAEAPGERFDPARPEHRAALAELARQLARLHNQTSEAWGEPWRPVNERGDPQRYWVGRLRKFRERITPATSSMTEEQIRAGLGRLERGLAALAIQTPSLLHGDVVGSVRIVPAERRLAWIDFGTVQYGMAEQDLADVRARMLGEEDFAEFLRVYQSERRGDRAVAGGSIRTFMLLSLWERLNSRVRRRRRRARAGRDGDAEVDRLADEQRRIERELVAAIQGE